MNSEKKKILITGASSGLGKALSEHLSKKGKILICIGQTEKKINLLRKELKDKRHLFFSGDLSNKKIQKKLFMFLKNEKGIESVIHCMGGGLGLKKDFLPQADLIKLLMVNLISQSEINNFVIKNMIKKNIKGKIIHISSIAGLESIASLGYSIAKAALIAYSKKLSKIFLNKGIFIKTILPGAFETEDNSFGRLKKKNFKAYQLFKNKKLVRKKYANSGDIIPLIEFMLSDKSNIISGSDIVADFSESNSFRI